MGNPPEVIHMPPHLVSKAESYWTKLVGALREAAKNICYKDITTLASNPNPSDSIKNLMGYILILLGMKNAWNVTTSSLLKEPFALLKLLREVEPLSIPIRRIQKAGKHWDSKLEESLKDFDSSELSMTNKLLRWVLSFKTIATIIVKANKAKLDRNKKGMSPLLGPVVPSSMFDNGFFENAEDDVLSIFASVIDEVSVDDGLDAALINFVAPTIVVEKIQQYQSESNCETEAEIKASEHANNENANKVSILRNVSLDVKSAMVHGKNNRSDHVAFSIGDLVDSRYKSGSSWFPGSIEGVNADGTFDVLYTDGDRESTVAFTLLRSRRQAAESETGDSYTEEYETDKLEKGIQIECRYKGGTDFFPGVISGVNFDGSYEIEYDDGDVESNVTVDLIKIRIS